MKTNNKNLIKVISSTFIAAPVLLSSLFLTPALAESITPTVTDEITKTPVVRTTKPGDNETTRTANLKIKADNEIDRRVNSLNELISKINASKRITSAQKTSFVTDIQSYITTLQTLKTKIDNDTDLSTLKSDVKSIVDSFRIYALYMPKMQVLEAVDRIYSVADQWTTFANKLNDRITKAKTDGKDVTGLNDKYTDMLAKITDAKKQADNASNAVINLNPTGYPANKTQLEQARTFLKNAETDFKAARTDAKSIIDALKALYPEVTKSVTPTTVVTTTKI